MNEILSTLKEIVDTDKCLKDVLCGREVLLDQQLSKGFNQYMAIRQGEYHPGVTRLRVADYDRCSLESMIQLRLDAYNEFQDDPVTYLRKSHILFEGGSSLPKEAIIKGFSGNAFSIIDDQMILNEDYHDGLDGGNRKELENLATLVNATYIDAREILAFLFNECLQANRFEELYYGLIKLAKYMSMINVNPRHFKPHDNGNVEKVNLIEALFLHEVSKIIY